jgi:3',5'-cyclic-AMP phosphodiesterase
MARVDCAAPGSGRLWPAALALALLFAACRVFEFTPYEIPDPEGPAAETARNLGRLEALAKRSGGPVRFALLADSHDSYDELARAADRLNADSTIQFAVLAGDFTQYGLLREYEWYAEAVSRLRAPLLTVIGNHDALANGAEIYRRRYGPLNFAFTFGGFRFVCANTNIWDSDEPAPDWDWLEHALATAGSLRVVLVSHIPPFGDQFDERARDRWRLLLARHGVRLSLHGHQHNYRFEETYGDGVRYLVADDVGARNYLRVTLVDSLVEVERIWF